MWGLDAVGLYQPQVPGQEEELQELRDRSAGPVHGKQALPRPPHPHGNLRFNLPSLQRAFPCSWDLRTFILSTTNFNLKNSGPSISPAEAPPSSLLKGQHSTLSPLFPPGGEGAHLPGLHHGGLPDQLHGKGLGVGR